MKILVTGHKGYIGSHLFQALQDQGFKPHGIDLKEGEDICSCLPNQDFDYVFHFAALPRVEFSVLNPSYTLKQNVYATSILLEWAKNHKVKRVILSSSSAVNGHGDGIPLSPYGLHKLINEQECQLYSRLYDLDTVCLRYFNAYSEDQPYGGAYSTVISAWMEMLHLGKSLRIDGDGEQERDLVHVKDIVNANLCAMNFEGHFSGESMDVGLGECVTINYIKNFIDQRCDPTWIHAEERAGDARKTLANTEKLRKLGWSPSIGIDEGLDLCFSQFYK
jgi:UDP-glucose 4-epimerase